MNKYLTLICQVSGNYARILEQFVIKTLHPFELGGNRAGVVKGGTDTD